MIRFLCLSVVVTAIAATSAQAQSRRELAERIDATEVRIGELEAQFLAGDPVVETLMERLDALDYQIREMTGQVEQLEFENRQLRQQLEALDSQVNPPVPAIDDAAAAFMSEGLEAMPQDGEPLEDIPTADPRFADARAAATGTLGGPVEAMPVADPMVLFQSAQSRLLDGDFDGAQLGFEQFVADHADHGSAGEAYYWLGETFYVRDNFGSAADNYIASLRTQPNGPRAPDALVRLAASLRGLGRVDEACDTLGRFSRQFPNAGPDSRDRAARESVRANC
ncbi:MAG: tetratricopeptide repeat protein [Alphaproteobacteria bacterium]|nr:tetratricopeptide repeat protein [Alphaproteobacteria bacterium]